MKGGEREEGSNREKEKRKKKEKERKEGNVGERNECARTHEDC